MSIFSSMPELPVVPLPASGEALSSWLRAIAELYVLPFRDYLLRLGIQPHWITPAFDRRLHIRPPEEVLNAIQRDTGVRLDLIRQMTFSGIDREMEEACLGHFQPCSECERAAGLKAGRRVSLLSAQAPWHVVCPYHPPYPRDREVAPDLPLALIYGQVRTIIETLDQAVYDQAVLTAAGLQDTWQGTMVPGIFIRLVHLLNAHVVVKVLSYDDMRQMAEYAIVQVFREDERLRPEPLPGDLRNSLAISLLFAWQCVMKPTVTLVGYCRAGPHVGWPDTVAHIRMHRLLEVLLEVMPGSIAMRFLNSVAWREWRIKGKDSTAYSQLALHAVGHLGNTPDFLQRLRRAHINHQAISRMLLFEFPDRGWIKTSKFCTPGPFLYKDVGGAGRSPGFMESARAFRFNRPGYRQFGVKRAAVVPRCRKKDTAETRGGPRRALRATDGRPYREAIQAAMAAHGPIPEKMTAKERDRLMNRLLRMAAAELEAARTR